MRPVRRTSSLCDSCRGIDVGIDDGVLDRRAAGVARVCEQARVDRIALRASDSIIRDIRSLFSPSMVKPAFSGIPVDVAVAR